MRNFEPGSDPRSCFWKRPERDEGKKGTENGQIEVEGGVTDTHERF